MDRSFWEKVQHVLTAAPDVTPDYLEKAVTTLQDSETFLYDKEHQALMSTGGIYKLSNFGDTITSTLKAQGIPSWMVTKTYGFSPLVVFHEACASDWQELYTLPTVQREAWRKAHPEEEAELIFWGKYSKTVFTSTSPGGKEVMKLLAMWSDEYGITEANSPSANWADMVPIYAR
jgi:hypothetical protein